jgi:uncharacterized protein (DUF1015 family)
MPEVKGFSGYRYNPEVVGALSEVITPPYDVIADDEREQLAARNPYCHVHLILPQDRAGEGRYLAAAEDLERFLHDGALRQDAEESLYLLEQTFRGNDGTTHTRRGFFAVVKLPEPGEKIILGHERTFQGPVEDRLALTEATKANLGPIFVLYNDPDKRLGAFLAQMDHREPDMEARTIDGVTQRLWRVGVAPEVIEFFADHLLYIADGHHRFQTAVFYRDQMRKQHNPKGLQLYDYCLAGFVAFDDPGLVIYPPHRLLDPPSNFDPKAFMEALANWFTITTIEGNLAAEVEKASGTVLGLALHGHGQYLLELKAIDRREMLGEDHGPAWRDLDVAVLHRGILENLLGLPKDSKLVYERGDAANALAQVERGEFAMAFILNATRPEQIRACAEAGEAMPQKSTYFFPKLPSGAVIYRLVE